MSKKKEKTVDPKDAKPLFSAHIPDSVQKQGTDADAALAANNEPPIIDDPSKPTLEPEPAKPAEPAPAEPAPKEPAVADPLTSDGNVDWEHKFNVLKGKYESESKVLQDTNKNLLELSENQGQVLAAQAQAAIQLKVAEPLAPVTDTVVAPDVEALDVKNFTSYGDEIEALATRVNMMMALIRDIIAGGGGTTNIDPKRLDRLEETVQVTAEEKYFNELDKAVPKWREIDNSPAWKTWLNTQDGVSLFRHGDMLRSAAENYRHIQVIAIFKKYAAETEADLGIVAPAAPAAPAAKEPVTVGNSNIVDETKVDPLATQAMPDQTVAGGEVKVKAEFPTKEEYQKAVKDYTAKKITLDQFNEVANRYQMGKAAELKAQQS